MQSPPHNSSTAEAHPSQPAPTEVNEFSPQERALLLRVAHEAIESACEDRPLQLDPPSSHLAEPRGVFTTVYLDGKLRGCVGYVLPVTPLHQAVAETARAAASQDTRFCPVSREEAPLVQISLSVLSRLKPIDPEQVEIGRHGLVVTLAGHRGLLLPQVAVEHHWDRVAFLEQTCRKAGLPTDAWKAGATLEAFTAEVFGDPDRPA
jgi:AmmeMemoRadiSam system protein A